jgi:hypothetical protein
MVERRKLGVVPSPAALMEQLQRTALQLQQRREERFAVLDQQPEGGFTRQSITATRGPTYQFDGRLLGEHSTNNNGKRSKWTEIRLWQTVSGKWIAESAGCSDEPGQVDIVDAAVINGDRDGTRMEFQAMDFWGWTSPAKALAKKLGWDLIVVVD